MEVLFKDITEPNEMGETLLKKEVEEEVIIVEVEDRGCRPVAFVLGFPFALGAGLLSLSASIVWLLGSLLTRVCPRLSCVAYLANKAMDLIRLPMDVFRWFFNLIPF